MKTFLLILLASIFQISCLQKNSDLSFLNGEWMSDSLQVKNDDHWREFLYFRNGKLLAQTTWWGQNYVLNKNLDIQKNQFTDAKGKIYSIKRIDSLTIEVKGNEYYGRFIKEKFQPENINSAIREFEKAQKKRTIFLGNWKIIKIKKRFRWNMDLKDPINQAAIKNSESDKILDCPINLIDHIQLDKTNFTIYSKNGKNDQYPYILTPESIQLSSEDMIFDLKYSINSAHQLTIASYNTFGIYIDIIFAKQ